MSLQETLDPDPLEIDPRPCEWCGLTIDQHIMVDDGDGPEFFCEEIHPHGADLVRQWEMQDPRDAWRHTGETAPAASFRNSKPSIVPRAYRTPKATIDACMWLARYRDLAALREWLRDHRKDAPYLLMLLKGKADA